MSSSPLDHQPGTDYQKPARRAAAGGLGLACAMLLGSASCESLSTGQSDPVPAAKPVDSQARLDAAMAAADAAAARFANREIIPYTVKDGDTLWEIARDHKVGIADIRAASNLPETETVILPGQVLQIPLPEGVSAAGLAAPPSPSADPAVSDPTRPAPPAGLPEATPPATTATPEPLAPAESGLPAPPPPPDQN
jgi:LysM repeat protein